MGLTKKQREVLDFIRSYIDTEGIAPTYNEIQTHFGLKSKGSVHDYISYLKRAGHLKDDSHSVRGLQLRPDSEELLSIPLMGVVAAGVPLDVANQQGSSEMISIPQRMLVRGECYALRVQGNSMVEDSILDGDIIVVKGQENAENGETVIALVEGAATVKKFYKKGGRVELHPANSLLRPLIVAEGDLRIQGIVVGLMRNF